MKEYENSHVHTVKKMKHNESHQNKGHIHIDNGVHPLWVMSLGLGFKSEEVTSLNDAR